MRKHLNKDLFVTINHNENYNVFSVLLKDTQKCRSPDHLIDGQSILLLKPQLLTKS